VPDLETACTGLRYQPQLLRCRSRLVVTRRCISAQTPGQTMDTTGKGLEDPHNPPTLTPELNGESLLGCPGDTLCLLLTPSLILQMKLSPTNTCPIWVIPSRKPMFSIGRFRVGRGSRRNYPAQSLVVVGTSGTSPLVHHHLSHLRDLETRSGGYFSPHSAFLTLPQMRTSLFTSITPTPT